MKFTIFDIMLKVFAPNNSNIYALENDDYFDCFSIKPEPKPSTVVNPVKALMPIDIQNIIYNNDKEHKKEELKTRERNISKYLITGTRTKSYSPNEEKLITEICDANAIIFSKTQAQIEKFIKNSSAVREFYVLSKNKNYWLPKNEIEAKLKNVDLETPHIGLLKSIANTFNETYIEAICSELGLESIKADFHNVCILLTSAIFIALINSDFYENEKYSSLKETIKKNLITYVESESSKLTPKETIIKKDFLPLDEKKYIPREKEAKILLEYLDKGKKPISVNGDGGLGKSEFVRHFAYTNREKYNFIFLHFNTNIKNTISNIVLSNENDIKFEHINGERILRSIDEVYEIKMNVLRQRDENTILIIDNFDAGEDTINLCKDKYYKELLELPVNVIFTTRAKLDGIDLYPVDIKEMSLEQLLNLMNSYTYIKDNISDELLEEIITLVFSHTLTVDLIARLLDGNRLTRVSAHEIIEKLNNQDYDTRAVISSYNRDNKEGKIIEHLKTIFNLSSFSEKAKYVMSCAALLSNLGLNTELFLNAIGEEYETTIIQLLDSGWIKNINNSICVHPILSIVSNSEVTPTFNMNYCFILNLLSLIKTNSLNLVISENFLCAITNILINFVKLLDYSQISEKALIYSELSQIFRFMGKHAEELLYLQKELEEIQSTPPKNNVRLSSIYSRMALALVCEKNITYDHQLLTNLSLYTNKAIKYCILALNDLDNIDCSVQDFKNVVIQMANTTQNAGHAIIKLAENTHSDKVKKVALNDALRYYEMSLETLKHCKIDELEYEKACIYVNLGNVYHKLQQNVQAEELLTDATKIFERKKGNAVNINLANAYISLSNLVFSSNNVPSSINYLEKAIAIYGNIYNKKSPLLIKLYLDIIYLYQKTKNYPKIVDYGLILLSIYEASENKYNKEMIKLNSQIGYAYYCQNLYLEALKHYCKAELLHNRYITQNNTGLLNIKMNKASMNRHIGNTEEALTLYDESFDLIKFSNNKALDMFLILAGKGITYHKIGSIDLAEELYAEADKFVDESLDVVAEHYTFRGIEYLNTNHKEKASVLFNKALNIYDQDPEGYKNQIDNISKYMEALVD